MGKKQKDVLDKRNLSVRLPPKDMPKINWRKFGKTGKLLRNMRLINPLYLLCLDCLSNGLLKANYPAEYMAAV
jgi:hypothetical protein